jgi:excisionase family DNA binding protein
MSSSLLEPQLTTEDAARLLKTTPETIRTLLREGALRGSRLGDGPRARYRIAPDELERFLDRRTQKDARPPDGGRRRTA